MARDCPNPSARGELVVLSILNLRACFVYSADPIMEFQE